MKDQDYFYFRCDHEDHGRDQEIYNITNQTYWKKGDEIICHDCAEELVEYPEKKGWTEIRFRKTDKKTKNTKTAVVVCDGCHKSEKGTDYYDINDEILCQQCLDDNWIDDNEYSIPIEEVEVEK